MEICGDVETVEMVYMTDSIWYHADLLDAEEPDLIMLFGGYATVIKYTMMDGRRIEHSKRMPMALAVEEVLRAPMNGAEVVAAKIVDAPPGKWDMSMSAPYYNPWALMDTSPSKPEE